MSRAGEGLSRRRVRRHPPLAHEAVQHERSDGGQADGKLELRPIGEGIIDHKRAAQILKEANYSGYLSGEWIGWEPYEVHLPRELAKMKEIERQLHT